MAGSEDPGVRQHRPLGRRRDVRLRPRGSRGAGRERPRGRHQPTRPTRRRRPTPQQRRVRVLLHDPRRRWQRDHPAGDHPRHVGLSATSGPVGTMAVRTACDRGRRDPALGLARGGPPAHGQRGHRGRRPVGAQRRTGGPVLRLRQLRRGGVRRPSAVSTSVAHRIPTSPSAPAARTSASGPISPDSS